MTLLQKDLNRKKKIYKVGLSHFPFLISHFSSRPSFKRPNDSQPPRRRARSTRDCDRISIDRSIDSTRSIDRSIDARGTIDRSIESMSQTSRAPRVTRRPMGARTRATRKHPPRPRTRARRDTSAGRNARARVSRGRPIASRVIYPPHRSARSIVLFRALHESSLANSRDSSHAARPAERIRARRGCAGTGTRDES